MTQEYRKVSTERLASLLETEGKYEILNEKGGDIWNGIDEEWPTDEDIQFELQDFEIIKDEE